MVSFFSETCPCFVIIISKHHRVMNNRVSLHAGKYTLTRFCKKLYLFTHQIFYRCRAFNIWVPEYCLHSDKQSVYKLYSSQYARMKTYKLGIISNLMCQHIEWNVWVSLIQIQRHSGHIDDERSTARSF